MTLTLYMSTLSPPVRAVLFTAASLGVDMEHKDIDLLKKEQFDPEFVKVSKIVFTSLACYS